MTNLLSFVCPLLCQGHCVQPALTPRGISASLRPYMSSSYMIKKIVLIPNGKTDKTTEGGRNDRDRTRIEGEGRELDVWSQGRLLLPEPK